MIEKFLARFRVNWRHSNAPSPHVSRGRRHRRLGMERVEDRLMLSATFNVPSNLNLVQLTMATEGGFIDFEGEACRGNGAFYGNSDAIRLSYTTATVQGELTDRTLSTTINYQFKLITLVPDEAWPEADQGGLIDVTPVINEPVSLAEPLPTIGHDWETEIASVLDRSETAEADSSESMRPPISLDGARGRSQAFELAMLPVSGWPAEEVEYRGESESAVVLPVQQSVWLESPSKAADGEPTRPDTVSRRSSSDESLDGKLGSVAPPAHDEHAGPDSTTQHDPTGTSISGRHEAFFADLAKPSDHAVASAVYIDNNRQADLIPLLAVAIVGQQMLKRQSHARGDGRTRLIPPRRRDKATTKPA